MAKLMSRMSLAIWLTVVMALIVGEIHSMKSLRKCLPSFLKTPVKTIDNTGQTDHTDESDQIDEIGNIKELKAVPVRERTERDWKMLVKDCFGSDRTNLQFKVTFKGTDCDSFLWDKLISILADNKNELYRKCSKLIDEYFEHSLVECGYEARFKQLADKIKPISPGHWSFAGWSSLNSYAREDFLKNLPLSPSGDFFAILSAIDELSKAVSHKETDCGRQNQISLVHEIIQLKSSPRLSEFAKARFALFLDNCGYENNFKQMIENVEMISSETRDSVAYPTLYSSLKDGPWEDLLVPRVFSAVQKLSSLKGTPEGTYCTEKFLNELVKWLSDINENWTELHKFIKVYFRLCLENCGLERQFRQVIDNVKQISAESPDSVAYPKLYNCLEGGPWNKRRVAELLLAIKELSELKSRSKETNCSREHLNSLTQWLSASSLGYPELHNLIKAYFSQYLDECGYEESFSTTKVHYRIFLEDASLASYLFSKPLANLKTSIEWYVVRDVNSTLDVVKKLGDSAKADALDCSKETSSSIYELKIPEDSKDGSHLKDELDGMIKAYWAGCANQFKNNAQEFAQKHQDDWAFIVKSCDLMEEQIDWQQLRGNPNKWVKSAARRVAADMKAGELDGKSDSEMTKQFRENFESKCKVLLNYVRQDLDTLTCDVKLALDDDKIKELMKYLSCCSRMSYDSEMEPIFKKIHTPFYPEDILTPFLPKKVVQKKQVRRPKETRDEKSEQTDSGLPFFGIYSS